MHFKHYFKNENDRILLEVLGHMRPGWTVLQDAVLAGDQKFPELRIEYVLAHPASGVAILDIMPTMPTSSVAAQQMRRQLEAAGEAFAQADQPIVHVSLHHSELSGLEAALDRAFGREPAVPVRCGETSVAVLQSLLGATPLEAAPEAEPARALQAPPASVMGPLEDEHRHAPEQSRQVRLLFAFWGAVLSMTAGAFGALSYLGPGRDHPASPLPPPPAVAADGVTPAQSREAREFADVRPGAPEAAEQGAADAPAGVAPVVSAPGDAPVPPGRARVPALHAPPHQELSAPPSVVGALGQPEAPASQSDAAALDPDGAEPDPTAESIAVGPVPSAPVPGAASVPDPAPGQAAAAAEARTFGAAHPEDPEPVAPESDALGQAAGRVGGAPDNPGAQTAGAAAIAQIALDAGDKPSVYADRRTTRPRDDHSGADAPSLQEPAGLPVAVAGDAAASPTRPAHDPVHDMAVLPPATVDAWTTRLPVQAGAAPAPETEDVALDQRTPSTAVSGGASPGRSPFEDAPQVVPTPQAMASAIPPRTAVERAPPVQIQPRSPPPRTARPAADSGAPSPGARCRTIVLMAQLGDEMGHADRSFLRNGCGARR